MEQQRFLAGARAPALADLQSEARTLALLEPQNLEAQLARARNVGQCLARVLRAMKHAETIRKIRRRECVDALRLDQAQVVGCKPQSHGFGTAAEVPVVERLLRFYPFGLEQHCAEFTGRAPPIDAPDLCREFPISRARDAARSAAPARGCAVNCFCRCTTKHRPRRTSGTPRGLPAIRRPAPAAAVRAA